jgi:hypothetical protein
VFKLPLKNPQDGITHVIEHGLTECGYRARYIDEARRRYGHLGMEFIGSVSRDRMAVEMAEAEVLAYPCDTIRFTEGFSVTIMEGCAAGAVPVISNVDALGGIYGGICPMVEAPARDHMDQWTEKVIAVLRLARLPSEYDLVRSQCAVLAEAHAWPVLAERLEGIMLEALATKAG